MRTTIHLAAVALSAGFIVAPALAQDVGNAAPQRDRERTRQARPAAPARPAELSPERMQDVWKWEARTVAVALQLDESVRKAVVADWLAVRTDLQEQVKAMGEARRAERAAGGERAERPERAERGQRTGRGMGNNARGGGDTGPGAAMREAAMTTLRTKLSATLSGSQLDDAMKAFDVPTVAWDRATNAIVALELEGEDRMKALRAAHAHLAGLHGLREEMAGNTDRGALRERMQTLRSELEKSMQEAGLDEEQMASVMAAMSAGRAARAGRGRRGGDAAAGRGARRGPGAEGAGGAERPGRGGAGNRGGRGNDDN